MGEVSSGDDVKCADLIEHVWREGVVTKVDPLEVRPVGFKYAYKWDFVVHMSYVHEQKAVQDVKVVEQTLPTLLRNQSERRPLLRVQSNKAVPDQKHALEVFRTLFDTVAKKGSDTISRSDLMSGLMKSAEARTVLGVPDSIGNSISAIFDAADIDSSGQLSFEELFRYWLENCIPGEPIEDFDIHRPNDWPAHGQEQFSELKAAFADKEDCLLVAALAQAKYDLEVAKRVLA